MDVGYTYVYMHAIQVQYKVCLHANITGCCPLLWWSGPSSFCTNHGVLTCYFLLFLSFLVIVSILLTKPSWKKINMYGRKSRCQQLHWKEYSLNNLHTRVLRYLQDWHELSQWCPYICILPKLRRFSNARRQLPFYTHKLLYAIGVLRVYSFVYENKCRL